MRTLRWSAGVPRKSVPSEYLLFLPKYSGTQVPMCLHRAEQMQRDLLALPVRPSVPSQNAQIGRLSPSVA